MDLTDSILTYLRSAPGSGLIGQDVTLRDHWQGRDHLLWRVVAGRGGEVLVKLFLDAGQARSRRQYEGQLLYAPAGLAPQPLWMDRYPQGLSRQLLAYRWAPGEALQADNAAQMEELAAAAAQVHGSDPEAVQRVSPHPINLDYYWQIVRAGVTPILHWLGDQQAQELAALAEQLAQAAEGLVTAALPLWQTTQPAPLHGDLRLENCVESFGQIVLLDWEQFGLGDPAQEVANFLYLHAAELSPEIQDLWLSRYLEQAEQPGLAQRIQLYGPFLAFRAVCFLLDGLRKIRPDDGPTDAVSLSATVTFLTETTLLSLEQAAQALELAAPATETIQPILDRLIRRQLKAGPLP